MSYWASLSNSTLTVSLWSLCSHPLGMYLHHRNQQTISVSPDEEPGVKHLHAQHCIYDVLRAVPRQVKWPEYYVPTHTRYWMWTGEGMLSGRGLSIALPQLRQQVPPWRGVWATSRWSLHNWHKVSHSIFLIYLLVDSLIEERERKGEKEREKREGGRGGEGERNINLLFHLFMHSLVDYCVHPDEIKLWHNRTTL